MSLVLVFVHTRARCSPVRVSLRAMSQRWGRKTAANKELALSLAQALFGAPRRGPATRGRRGEGGGEHWSCAKCAFSNYGWRKECFKCGCTVKRDKHKEKEKGAGVRDTTSTAATAKPAPWVKTREAASRATVLEAALRAARDAGGDDQFVKELETKLASAQKESVDSRPLGDQLAGCRAAIARRKKRLEVAEKAVKDAEQLRKSVFEDLEEHRLKLEELEAEADDRAGRRMAVDDDDEAPAAAPAAHSAAEVAELRARLEQQEAAATAQAAQAAQAAQELRARLAQHEAAATAQATRLAQQ